MSFKADWQLYVNVGKCHVLHIGKSNHPHRYFFNGCQINDACIVFDLSIEIDSSLKYDAHIIKIVAKAYSRVGVLCEGFTTRSV